MNNRITRKPKKVRKMTALTMALVATMVGFNLSNVASAETRPTTLDTINGRSTYIINNDKATPYNLTKLTSGTAPEGTVTVKIGSDTYQYTPNNMPEGYTLTDYQNLSNTGNVALTEKSATQIQNAINLKVSDSEYYSYTISKLPVSIYNVTSGTAGDYNFYTTDTSGNKTYYKINIPSSKLDSSRIDWSDTSATGYTQVTVNLPNSKTQDLYYKITGTTESTRINDTLATTLKNNVVYKDISTTENGGAIYNTKDCSTVNINADFIGNSTTYYGSTTNYGGGAIYNSSEIKGITGNFIQNSTARNGGAINNSGEINTIVGDFIGNNTTNGTDVNYGGAIYNYKNSTIGSITGNFIGNYATSGGAIYNPGTITSITGDFIGNSVKFGAGAISNDGGTITSITGDFIGNSALGTGGGAIFVNSMGSINSITGDFIGNRSGGSGGGAIRSYATIGSITGDFISNSSTGKGGAILNSGANAKISSITGDFIGNSASTGGAIYNDASKAIDNITGDFIGNSASTSGGAIYNAGTINFSGTNTFTGNTASSVANDIYNAGTLKINSGTTSMDGGITGTGSTTIGDGTNDTVLNLVYNSKNADLQQANLTVNQKGSLIVNAAELAITNTISNAGTITLKGDNVTNNNAITGDGTTIIDGIVTQTIGKTIANAITVNAEKSLTIGAGNVGGAVANSGTVNLGAGTLANAITGSGTITTTGNVTTNAGNLGNAVTNANNLTLTGGTLAKAITGTGTITTTGNVTTNAGNLENAVTNANNLTLTGGTLAKAITGTGSTNIGNGTDTITVTIGADGSIAQAVTIATKGTLTSDISKLTGTITNNGTFNMSGDLSKDIAGTAGTTVLQSDSASVTDGVTIAGTLNTNGKTINMQDSPVTYQTLTVGSLTSGTDKTTNLSIDVDVTKNGDKAAHTDSINITSGANNGGTLNLSSINVTGTSYEYATDTYDNFVDYVTGNTSGITYQLMGGTSTYTYGRVKEEGGYSGRLFQFNLGDTGSLDMTVSDANMTLTEFISDKNWGNQVKTYSINDNYSQTGNIGTTVARSDSTKELSVALNNGSDLTATTPTYTGFDVDNGCTLNITGTADSENKPIISNFKQALNVKSGSTANVSGVTFEDNKFSSDETACGGAIYNAGTITNLNSDFTGNYTSGNTNSQGGAIYNEGTIGDTTNSTGGIGTVDNYATFTGNGIQTVDETKTTETKDGGAIYNAATITNIYADFTGNKATTNGGAIANIGTSSTKIGNIVGTFDSNAAYSGGAIYNEGTITDIYADFTDNFATQYGGAIYNKGTISKIGTDANNKVTFEDNSVSNQRGGAIYNSGRIDYIYADFNGNSSDNNGGAIYNYTECKTSEIKDIVGNFTGNFTNANGGAIANYALTANGNDTAKSTITISKGLFENNWAKNVGGAILNNAHVGVSGTNNSDAILNLGDVTFKNNYISTDGGTTVASYNDIYNCTDKTGTGTPTATVNINGNVSMTGGITGNGTTNITSTGVLTLNHMLDADGFDKGLATLTQGEINVENGGIISLQNGKIDNFTLNNLGANSYATFNIDFDGIASAGSNIDLINITNPKGSAKAKVNAIKIVKDATAVGSTTATWLDGTLGSISDETADTIKSATEKYIYKFTKGDKGQFSVAITDITNVSLPEIVHDMDYKDITSYSVTTDTYILNDNLGDLAGDGRNFTIFGNNHTIDAKKDDDHIYSGINVAPGQTFETADVTMQNFSTTNVGGAIYNNGGTVNISNSIFNDNVASNIEGGGAIGNKNGILTITGGTFNGNKATGTTGLGGAIANTGKLTISGTTFTKNYAILGGGAIFNNSSTNEVTINNATFDSNTTDGTAGAIANLSGTINFTGTNTFTNNKANGTLSDIYNDGILNINGGTTKLDGGITGDGETTIENGATLALLGKNATLQQNTVNINNGSIYTAIENVNNNIANLNIKSDGTLKLTLDWGDALNDVTSGQTRTIETGGKILLSEIDFASYASNDSYEFAKDTLLRDYIAFTNDISLVNYTIANKALEYTKADGKLTLATVNSLQEAINKSEAGSTVVYAMTGDEGGITSNGLTGSLYVTSDNKTIDKLTVTVGTDSSTNNTLALVDTNVNIGTASSTENTDIIVKPDNQVVITAKNNDVNIKTVSDNLVSLKYDSVNNKNSALIINSDGGKVNVEGDIVSDNVANQVYYKGNHNINFKGLHDPGTSDVDLASNAVLTRDGLDDGITYNLNSGTLKYTNDKYLYDSAFHTGAHMNSMNFNGGALDLRNGACNDIVLNNLTLSADSNLYVNADLAANNGLGKMDTLNATGTVSGSGKLHVAGIQLLSDATNDLTTIDFTSTSGLTANVDYTGGEIAYSPIYKYTVNYDGTGSTGKFAFNRFGTGYNSYNPSVLAASVGAQVGAYLTQINNYEQAFGNMDMRMNMTQAERTALKFANKYASTETQGLSYAPNNIAQQNRDVWFRPYATFEKVGLNAGPTVENIAYGSLFGGDSDLKELSHGWDFVWGAYAGYNGSHQNYDGVSIYQNGGTLGLNAAWYKGNFFTGLTANVGASVAEASTMYGNENFTMLMTGIASKTGYNWELANGKFIIQPSLLMSYTFVNTFDYTNARGVSIDSDPLHAIQIVPGLKFIGNLPHGWQPYLGVQMVWNIMDKTHFFANDAALPQMSVDPYVQYGVGVQKRWGEVFTGYLQAMIRNGGRNGVALSAGFSWALGKDPSKGKLKQSNASKMELKKADINLSSMK